MSTSPRPPDLYGIRAHVGAGNVQKGRALANHGRVIEATFKAPQVEARVLGPRGERHELTALVSEARVVYSGCSCRMGSACEHVAAALLTVHERAEQERAQTTAATIPPLGGARTPRALRAWAQEHLVEDAIDDRLRAVLEEHPWLWAAERRYARVRDLLLADDARPDSRYDLEMRADLQLAMQGALKELSRRRLAARDYGTQAEAWRKEPPPEPELLPLWTWLRGRELPHAGWEAWIVAPPEHITLTVRQDPPFLEVESRHHKLPLQPDHQRFEEDEVTYYAVAVALDLLTHPALRRHKARQRVLAQVRVSPWERTLAALDGILEAATPAADEEGRELGWFIDPTPLYQPVLRPVLCRPYKRGDGLRTWSTPLSSTPMPLAADRAARDVLGLDTLYRGDPRLRARFNRAAAALVGHPRVVADKGRRLAVRRAPLVVGWVPTEDGGVRLEARVLDAPLEPAALHELVGCWAGELSVRVDLDAGRCVVVDIPAALHQLLNTLLLRGDTFPADSRGPLLERFARFANVAPMELHGELRGQEVPGDPRPLLRLAPSPDGALDVELRARPLPQARAWPPGEGPEQLSAVVDGQRLFTVRDLKGEPERMAAALAPLPLPEPEAEGARWVLTDPDQGLELVQAVRAQGEAFQVEWSRPAPAISRPATAEDLKVRGAQRRDWFNLEGGLDVDGVLVPLSELLEAVRRGRRFVAVGDAGWVALTERLRARLEITAALARTRKGGVELPPMASAALLPVAEDGAEVVLPERLMVQQARLREAELLQLPVPEGLNATLRPYQVEGYRWLARLAHWAPGAVLADDMGLGKTIQALTLLLRRAPGGPALVVAPASVGINWAREAARFAPSLRVQSYRGLERKALLAKLQPGDLLITSWDVMARDAEALSEVFHTVVMDEAQAIKNASALRSTAAAKLKGAFTLALTGTPVENRVGELWSLMRAVVPGLLGSAQRFRERVVVPIERDGALLPRRALASLLRPFVLRRLKSQVALDLPERSEQTLSVELSRAERQRYDAFRDAAVAELEGEDLPGDRPPDAAGDKRFRILAAITRMRQLACHPGLVYPEEAGTPSTKLTRLVRALVDLKEEGHRALVFSQFTTLLGFAREAIEAAGLSARYLDGATPLKRRQEEVDAFQAGEGDVFLISLKAGGTGLNLTAASYVFHLDPWWNPAVEDQATDRAHRIGQTQPVTVLRLVAVDTIEESVLELHAEKRALMTELMDGAGKAAAMSTRELLAVLQGGALADGVQVAGG